MALAASVFGNKPANLQGENPSTAVQDSAPPLETPAGAVSMPPMTIQAGREPAAGAPPSSGLTPEQVADMVDAQAAGSAPAGDAGGGLTPEQTADLVEAQHAAGAAPPDVQGPPELIKPGDSGFGSTMTHLATRPAPAIVRLPDGQPGFLERGGQIRHLNEQEKQAFGLMAQAVKIGGPTIGAMFGEAAGGPLGAMAGGGVGGEAVAPVADQYSQAAGNAPHARTNTERAIDTVAPAVGGAIGKSFAGSGIVNTAANDVAQAGSQAIAEAGAQGAANMKASGLPDLPAGTPGTPQVVEGTKAIVQKAFKQIQESFKPQAKALGAGAGERTPPPGPAEALQSSQANMGKSIKALADKASQAARSQQFDTTEMGAAFERVLRSKGLLKPDGTVVERVASEELPLVRAYENFKAATEVSVSPEGLGATGNKVPARRDGTLPDQRGGGAQVQEPVRGLQEKGKPIQVGESSSASKHIQEGAPLHEAGQQGFADILLGPKTKAVSAGPEQGATPYTKMGEPIPPNNTTYPAKQTQMGLNGLTEAKTPINLAADRTNAPTVQSGLPLSTIASQPNASSQLPPNAAGGGQRGLTLTEMNKQLATVEDQANFSGRDRTPTERAFGELYHEIRNVRDGYAAQALQASGAHSESKVLLSLRKKFSDNIDAVRQLEGEVTKNPEQAFEVLGKKGDLQRAQQLKQVLPKEAFLQLGDQFMTKISGKIDSGGAKAAISELESYGPEVGKTYLGSEYPRVMQLLRGAQALEGRATSPETKQSLLRMIGQAVRHPGYFVLKHGDELLGKLVKDPALRAQIGQVSASAGGAAGKVPTPVRQTLGTLGGAAAGNAVKP